MKTIQKLFRYQFAERAIIVGDGAIKAAVFIGVFILLILPFVLMVARLS